MKLFYIILGASVKGRTIEQHDVFFGIAEKLKDLVPAIKEFWPEAGSDLHLDAYQEVKFVDGYEIRIVEKGSQQSENQLFFINLGGYKKGFFEEFHEQHLMVGGKMSEVIKKAKQTEFYKTMGFGGAVSHVDDKHGVDIDDVFKVNDLLSQEMKDKYSLILEKSSQIDQKNFIKLKYLKIDKI
ncbi:DUF1543 domain-containing protein [Kaistella faecalis]|uniref:DUF1543 domain-containing protein n=1 Tax=Kaistella faecalis TaxID=2852098 RepID=UPI001C4574C8|nr:DUF1543 domain-containing protein [Chryseobacterium faecale]UFK98431.1 DUF1543 domain-containing protein [Chryseobacterium faecale]